MILLPSHPIPQVNSVGFGEGGSELKGLSPSPAPPFPPAARVPAPTRMRCMTRPPHACRTPPALRERTDTGQGAGRLGRNEWRGGFPELRGSPSPTHTHTAISFSWQTSSLLYFSWGDKGKKRKCKLSYSHSENLWFHAILSQLKVTNLRSSDTET